MSVVSSDEILVWVKIHDRTTLLTSSESVVSLPDPKPRFVLEETEWGRVYLCPLPSPECKNKLLDSSSRTFTSHLLSRLETTE